MKSPTAVNQFTTTRKELAEKYFAGLSLFYADGNMGIIALLSDVQEGSMTRDYRTMVLNDIKCVLGGTK